MRLKNNKKKDFIKKYKKFKLVKKNSNEKSL